MRNSIPIPTSDWLAHGGPGSGRYPKGSGERPYQHGGEGLSKQQQKDSLSRASYYKGKDRKGSYLTCENRWVFDPIGEVKIRSSSKTEKTKLEKEIHNDYLKKLNRKQRLWDNDESQELSKNIIKEEKKINAHLAKTQLTANELESYKKQYKSETSYPEEHNVTMTPKGKIIHVESTYNFKNKRRNNYLYVYLDENGNRKIRTS